MSLQRESEAKARILELVQEDTPVDHPQYDDFVAAIREYRGAIEESTREAFLGPLREHRRRRYGGDPVTYVIDSDLYRATSDKYPEREEDT